MIAAFHQEAGSEQIGRKGHNRSRMWREGLPVPPGFSVTCDGKESLDASELQRALKQLEASAFAVRSSAIQEDDEETSFAGMFVSKLNIVTTEDVVAALEDIRISALSPEAIEYSRRRNVPHSSQIAAVVQTFIPAEVSGVLFMRDPRTGADHFVVEACWGLGPGVVNGLVRPDQWVLSADGTLISSHIADKDIAIVPGAHGGTVQTSVDASCRRRPCLTIEALKQLSRLACRCESLFGSPQDIEWVLFNDQVWLLQSRPLTS